MGAASAPILAGVEDRIAKDSVDSFYWVRVLRTSVSDTYFKKWAHVRRHVCARLVASSNFQPTIISITEKTLLAITCGDGRELVQVIHRRGDPGQWRPANVASVY